MTVLEVRWRSILNTICSAEYSVAELVHGSDAPDGIEIEMIESK